MLKHATPSINLAKNRGEHFIDRFFVWALSVGRVLVIATEALALGAFLFRFGLDKQILDLRDRINQEEAVVKLLKSNETTYRNLQDRLTLAKNIDITNASQLKQFQDILAMIPSTMDVQTVSYSTTDIHIDGTVGSVVELSTFVKKLKGYAPIGRVSIDKLENKATTGEYSIGITAFFNAAKPKPLL